MKLKVVLSIVVLIGVILSFALFSPFSADSEGSVQIIVRDSDTIVVIDEWVDFYEGDNLYRLLDRNYTIETSDRYGTSYGRLLLSIEGIDTNFEQTFIHISKDGVSANRGIDNIALEDGSTYEFEVRVPH